MMVQYRSIKERFSDSILLPPRRLLRDVRQGRRGSLVPARSHAHAEGGGADVRHSLPCRGHLHLPAPRRGPQGRHLRADAGPAKGLMTRDVQEVITPGTVLDDGFLSRAANNSFLRSPGLATHLALAYADVSTGELGATSFPQPRGSRSSNGSCIAWSRGK